MDVSDLIGIVEVRLTCSLKEGLAGLAGTQAIVFAAGNVAANKTSLLRIEVVTEVMTDA